MKRNRQKEVEQKVRVDMCKAEMRSVGGEAGSGQRARVRKIPENVEEEITVSRNSMKCKHLGNKDLDSQHVRLCSLILHSTFNTILFSI